MGHTVCAKLHLVSVHVNGGDVSELGRSTAVRLRDADEVLFAECTLDCASNIAADSAASSVRRGEHLARMALCVCLMRRRMSVLYRHSNWLNDCLCHSTDSPPRREAFQLRGTTAALQQSPVCPNGPYQCCGKCRCTRSLVLRLLYFIGFSLPGSL